MGPYQTWSSTRFSVGPIDVLIYINDLPITLNKMATSVIFADDMSIIITNNNKTDFENALQQTMIEMSFGVIF